MNNIIKLLSYFYLFTVSQYWYASQLKRLPKKRNRYMIQLSQPERKLLVAGYIRETYDIPDVLHQVIRYFLHDNPLQYRGQKLPRSLAGQDLSGFDFRGCDFSFTDMRNTNLNNAILDNTICNYYKVLVAKGAGMNSGLFVEQLSKLPPAMCSHLVYISYVYPRLLKNNHRARLINIGSAIISLWLKLKQDSLKVNRYKEKEYAIKVFYYFFALWKFKESLKKNQLKELKKNDFGIAITSYLDAFYLNSIFHMVTYYFCWTSTYSGPKWKKNNQGKPQYMSRYAGKFKERMRWYTQKKSNYYYDKILESIEDLEKVYPQIKDRQMKQKACNIVCGFYKSYQFSERELFSWYLYWLKKLGEFKNNQRNKAFQDKIRYNPIPYPLKLKQPYV